MDWWLQFMVWIPMAVSVIGTIPIVQSWAGIYWLDPGDLVLAVQAAFVGAVYYLLATLGTWLRGQYGIRADWVSIVLSGMFIIGLGNWLGAALVSTEVLAIAVVMPMLVGVITFMVQYTRTLEILE